MNAQRGVFPLRPMATDNPDSTGPEGPDRAGGAEELYVEFMGRSDAFESDAFEELVRKHPEHADELRSIHGEIDNLDRLLDEAAKSPDFPFEELSRLHARGGHKRYRIDGEIARGGQGAVMRIWDEDLKRHLAMKLTLGRVSSSTSKEGGAPSPAPSTPPLDSRAVHRFLNEAKITGQLDHPGIVPIHELGVDDDGQAYFTMKLVNGHSLHEVFHRHRQGDPEWTTQRCVGLILKATEAVAYAHSKGIIHRDLKPANIMVGAYGEVYVMDWGMARDLAAGESGASTAEFGEFEKQGRTGREGMETLEGSVLGTPAYMPPEQARGDISTLNEKSDVYALGAVLYELLAGHAPYRDRSRDLGAAEVLTAIAEEAPTDLDVLQPQADSELVAIANMAMRRAAEERYGSAMELLSELRASSEGRVVRAHRTGLRVELAKWVRRNRALAGAVAAALLAALIGTLAVAASESRRADVAELSRQRAIAKLDAERARALLNRARTPWPILQAYFDEYQQWGEERNRLEREYGSYLEAQADPPEGWTSVYLDQLGVGTERLSESLDQLLNYRREIDEYTASDLCDDATAQLFAFRELDNVAREAELRWRLSLNEPIQLPVDLDEEVRRAYAQAVYDLQLLLDPDWGGGAWMAGALGHLRERRGALGEAAAQAWSRAVDSISDKDECPLYEGLRMEPLEGLLPLGRNLQSGLWEFAHLASGELPSWNPAQGATPSTESGLVFVLIPGGSGLVGSQTSDPSADRYDPNAKNQDEPIAPLGQLMPFFLSKFELTQAQWWRLARRQPSEYIVASEVWGNPRITPLHPVETVSWNSVASWLPVWGLELPSECQLEFAARALFQDQFGRGLPEGEIAALENWRENPEAEGVIAYLYHAPVGRFAPNAWGLYDVLGNVSELCADYFVMRPERLDPNLIRPGTCELSVFTTAARAYRGGHFNSTLVNLRVGARYRIAPDGASGTLGVRPAINLP